MSVRNTVKSIQDIMRQDVGVDGDAQRISQLCWMFFLKIIDDQDQQLELMQDGYRSPIPKPLQWRAWAADPEGITGDELLTFINTQLFPRLKELPTAGKQGDRRRVVRDVFTKYGPQARAVLDALLAKYQDDGVINLDDPRILQIAPFDSMGTPIQLIRQFGTRADFERAVHELQAALYQEVA